jgi:hypothetical protein
VQIRAKGDATSEMVSALMHRWELFLRSLFIQHRLLQRANCFSDGRPFQHPYRNWL